MFLNTHCCHLAGPAFVNCRLGEKGVVRNQLGGHQAFALALSSDRILMSNFFGFGNSTPDTNEQFPRASHALALVFSRGFTRNLVGEIGQSATWGRVWDYPAHLNVEGPFVESNRCQNVCTVLATCRDSRDHPINPAHGFRLRASSEVAAGVYFDNPASTRG